MGANTMCGHYVCHLRKARARTRSPPPTHPRPQPPVPPPPASPRRLAAPQQGGKWVLYNDSKVAVSERPPLELGYLYFFKRADLE